MKTLLIKIKVFWYASVWETAKAWEIGNQGLHDSTLLDILAAQDVSWTLINHHIIIKARVV